ncbi:armadillo repeat kinesin 3 [Perilla frutescens var. hirtella]|uniref:Kinesin-like protein n=1 Tax=Perilla frutescens var. hirtella TaxID=608512 RepID=A0AAD4IS62_PERFH|nr:armadillo repeat kinesin 3 [Perilla frutescens var. hirtella]
MSTNSYRNGGSGSRGGAMKFENYSNNNSKYSPSSSFKSKVQQSAAAASTLRRSSPGTGRDDSTISARVRVAVRLRPRNSEEMAADADFADCVELQSELKRLKLQKNNWDSDTYEFDEVLTEFASQKRVYEVVAKPVVESVLDGYNGTVMAYGQTGTGKTYTLGQLGEEDAADRGIMLRAMEDILAEVSPENDLISVSYLQLYMETIQDLLNPSNDNIAIVEDPKSGDVSLPGATLVEIRDHRSFMELLQLGEAHRFAANTRLNAESSRSHAILMVHVKRSVRGKTSPFSSENGNMTPMGKTLKPPIIRKSKLVIVDLAGSERIDKSGSEGHTLEEAKSINLSLSALGKCINALAENRAHVPVRDSKLTRLLRDSFGGTARTSLVITIGPSPRHRGETSSTIMFGQRAMKVENMVKLKEEFDYKSLSRKLEIQLDKLIAEHERQQKAFENEIERITLEAQKRVAEVEQNYADAFEKEKVKCQKDYMESVKRLEEQSAAKQENNGHKKFKDGLSDNGTDQKSNSQSQPPVPPTSSEVTKIKQKLNDEILLRKAAEAEVDNLNNQLIHWKNMESARNSEISKLRKMLEDEECGKAKLEEEIEMLQSQLLQISFEADQSRRNLDKRLSGEAPSSLDSLIPRVKDQQLREPGDGEKASVVKLFEQVGLHKILSLLQSEDADVRIHAVKVVANLAAEESNQEKIVHAGGLTSLLALLKSSNDETIHRVAAGAIANLAMNETNQELIMSQGGISLLSLTATKAEDPQTLRMVAGAIANLCGNDKLQIKLRAEGGIRALLGMVRCRHPDVLAQVARGIANFAKCESRASNQGTKTGKSVLIEDGALPWIVQNANNEASPIRRHIELALCHLAQHGKYLTAFYVYLIKIQDGQIYGKPKMLDFFVTEVNAREMINGGALWELVRISRDCSREDIRALAHRTLKSSSGFQAELKRLRIDYG